MRNLAAISGLSLLGFLLVWGLRSVPWPPLEAAGEEGAVVRAERFELVDDAGKLRGWLGVDEDGAAGLTLAGRDGAPHATLSVAADGPAQLRCARPNGRGAAVSLGVSEGGSSGLVLHDGAGRLAADLSLDSESGEPVPGIRTRRVIHRERVPVDGYATLRLHRQGEEPRVGVVAGDGGSSGLLLRGRKGRASLEVTDYGFCDLVFTRAGAGHASLALGRTGGARRAEVRLGNEGAKRHLSLHEDWLEIPGRDPNHPPLRFGYGMLSLRADKLLEAEAGGGWQPAPGPKARPSASGPLGAAALLTALWHINSSAKGPGLRIGHTTESNEAELAVEDQLDIRLGNMHRKEAIVYSIPHGRNLKLSLHDAKGYRAGVWVLPWTYMELNAPGGRTMLKLGDDGLRRPDGR